MSNSYYKRKTKITVQERVLKRKLQKSIKVNIILSLLLFISAISFITMISFYNFKLNNYKNELNNNKEEMLTLSKKFNKVSETLAKVSTVSVKLDEENKKLNIENNKLINKLNIIDKYEYSLFKNGKRTDIFVDDIITLQDYAKYHDMTQESIDLVLAIAMTESGGDSSAINTDSSASGLGQMLSKTGSFVYNKLMVEEEDYNHQTHPFDSEINLKMILAYLDYLNEKNNGDMEKIISSYRGKYDYNYIAKINNYLAINNLNLKNIKIK